MTGLLFQQASASKRKKEIEKFTALREKLLEEEVKQKEHVERVVARLSQVITDDCAVVFQLLVNF